MLPFVGTALGALCVMFTRRGTGTRTIKVIEGFSAGVMIAASIWSLLIPSIELSPREGALSVVPAVVGFVLGMLFFLLCDAVLSRYKAKCPDMGNSGALSGSMFPIIAVAVHNLPEGMAVGAIYAEVLSAENEAAVMSAAAALSVGIAVQNFPEGAIVSMPLHTMGMGKGKAFLMGILSGIIEPIGAFVTILAAGVAVPLLPYLLAFAAGAMVFAVFHGSSENGDDGVGFAWMIAFSLGFSLMMSLDVILG